MNAKRDQQLQEPARGRDVEVRQDGRERLFEIGRPGELVGQRAAHRRHGEPKCTKADRPAEGDGQAFAERPGQRVAQTPQHPRRVRGRQIDGRAEVPAGERLDPEYQQQDRHDGGEDEGRPVVLAAERYVVARPGPRGQVGRDAEGGHGGAVSVQDPTGEQSRAGDARPRAAPDEGRQDEGKPAEHQRHQADPEREADRRLDRDCVARHLAEYRGGRATRRPSGSRARAPSRSGARPASRTRCAACRTARRPRTRGCRPGLRQRAWTTAPGSTTAKR